MDPAVKKALEEDDKLRESFMKAALLKLGLQINQDEDGSALSLSPMHLSSLNPGAVAALSEELESSVEIVDGNEYVKAESDTFQIQRSSSTWSMSKLTRAALDTLSDKSGESSQKDTTPELKEGADPSETQADLVKTIILHEDIPPSAQETPYFNHSNYFSALSLHSHANHNHNHKEEYTNDTHTIPFGHHLLYATTTTSTSTLLEKNPKLTHHLPAGTTLTATRQLSGRGRGSNVWLSPQGSLMFSTVFEHPLALNTTAPLVFVQYLAGVAVMQGIQSYVPPGGEDAQRDMYEKVPVKLKWPNDIYALAPTDGPDAARPPKRDQYTKIGGILVNTSYTAGSFTVILGIGLNVSNSAPTTSLNALVQAMSGRAERRIEPFAPEALLASILCRFRDLYAYFRVHGFDSRLETLYYDHWLHSGQVVAVDQDVDGALEGGYGGTADAKMKARIKGVTRDWGLLLADEVVEGDGDIGDATTMGGDGRRYRGTGRTFALQSDSNSFDFMEGLLKRKV